MTLFYSAVLLGSDSTCPETWHYDGTCADTGTYGGSYIDATGAEGTWIVVNGDSDVDVYEVSKEHLDSVRDAVGLRNWFFSRVQVHFWFVKYKFRSRATET